MNSGASVPDYYSQYSKWLSASVRRLGGGEAADDIVQETFLRLSQRARDEFVQHPQALLLKIAQNVMRNSARSRNAAKRVQPDLGDDGLVGTVVAADQLEALYLKQLVMALPESYRDVFVLSRFHDMTNEQVARSCGISVKAVEWRLSRAVELCAARLRD